MEKTLILRDQEKINLGTIKKVKEVTKTRHKIILTKRLLIYLFFLVFGISLLFFNQIVWGAIIIFLNTLVYLILEQFVSAFSIDIHFDKKDNLNCAIMDDIFHNNSREDTQNYS